MPNMRLICVVLVVTTTAAWADDDGGIAALEKALVHTAPGPGFERARVGPPAWCVGPRSPEQRWAGGAAGNIEAYRWADHGRRHDTGQESQLVEAALLVCSAPRHPAAQHAAAEIEQLWINETGLAEADAVASLTARIDKDRFTADVEKACAQLPRDESDHEHRRVTGARRMLVGCDDRPPFWMNSVDLHELGEHLDRGVVAEDPLLRLTWLLYRLRVERDPDASPERRLPGYALDQFDLRGLTREAVLQAIEAPPYRGNRAAVTVVLESFARFQMLRARLEAEVTAQSADPKWRELLVDAPQRGFDAWMAAAAKHKDVLARSDALWVDLKDEDDDDDEPRRPGRGKNAVGDKAKRCDPLRADIMAILKPMKHDTVHTLGDEISNHPLAGMLIARLQKCMRTSGEASAANWLAHVASGVRVLRGPRAAAYSSIVEALGALRRKAPFWPRDLTDISVSDQSHRAIDPGPYLEGVVASVRKVTAGLKVTFVSHKQQVMSQSCSEGTKVDRVDRDGKVIYRQVCHDAGLVWTDPSPTPVTIPAKFAANIKPGRLMRFEMTDRDANLGIPLEVYADKVGKRLVNFYSLATE